MNFLINLKDKKKDFVKKENIIYLTLILIIFFIDRYSKLIVIDNFNNSTYYINDFINVDLTWNIGIGFGLLSTTSMLSYNLITTLIGLIITILFYFFIKSKKLEKFSYSIIIGGAVGNFYDRNVYKAVPDFIDIHYNNFHWFIFNAADIFITLGILLLLFNNKNFIKN